MTAPGFVPGADGATPPAPTDLALPVAGRKLRTRDDGVLLRIADLPADTNWVPLGTLDGRPAWATEVPSVEDRPETGRDPQQVALVEAYAKEQGLWHDPDHEPEYS
ncbi:hypothetical protein AB0I76_27275, partial [Micromonospora sp. NPDC049799]